MRPPQEHLERLFYVLFAGMFGGGIYAFIRGFRVYWEFRVLENIPLTPIRGLAMGLVRVRGRAAGDEWLTSPVSNQPCYYYKVVVEKWERDPQNKAFYWAPWTKDSDAVRFYLSDETGRVSVYPRGAELDLDQTVRTVINGELPSALTSASARREGPAVEPATSNPVATDANVELLRSMALVGSRPEVGRYRLTEHCILPEVWYDVTGTCVQNSLAKDVSDRNMIKKGTREPTFVISDKESREVEKRLDRRAVAYIFGGAFLAVASAALILLLAWTS
jgi:hypothetical protein